MGNSLERKRNGQVWKQESDSFRLPKPPFLEEECRRRSRQRTPPICLPNQQTNCTRTVSTQQRAGFRTLCFDGTNSFRRPQLSHRENLLIFQFKWCQFRRVIASPRSSKAMRIGSFGQVFSTKIYDIGWPWILCCCRRRRSISIRIMSHREVGLVTREIDARLCAHLFELHAKMAVFWCTSLQRSRKSFAKIPQMRWAAQEILFFQMVNDRQSSPTALSNEDHEQDQETTWLAVNEDGVSLLDQHSMQLLARYSYDNVVTFGGCQDDFMLVVTSDTSSNSTGEHNMKSRYTASHHSDRASSEDSSGTTKLLFNAGKPQVCSWMSQLFLINHATFFFLDPANHAANGWLYEYDWQNGSGNFVKLHSDTFGNA